MASSMTGTAPLNGTTLRVEPFDSPVGRLQLIARGDALAGLYFPDRIPARVAARVTDRAATPRETAVLDAVRRQLDEYFAGRRLSFDLALDPIGTTFQQCVWTALLDIPFGETVSYAAIARGVGRAAAIRAVGAANGANPVSIIVPCHRVIGSNGRLTGYGGGLGVKEWLLAHERRVRDTRG